MSKRIPEFNELFEIFTFPCGETNVRLNANLKHEIGNSANFAFSYRGCTSIQHLFNIGLGLDVLSNIYPHVSFNVYTPYFPFLRQDRRTELEVAHSLDLVLDIVELYGKKYNAQFSVLDPHTGVPAKCGYFKSRQLHQIVSFSLGLDLSEYAIVAPDAGCAAKLGNRVALVGSKDRCPQTGKLSNYRLEGTVPEGVTKLLVVDDIVQGGFTFKLLADALAANPQTKDMHKTLYITHFFAPHLDNLTAYDEIITTDSVYHTISDPKIKVVKGIL